MKRKIFNIRTVVYNGHETMARHTSQFRPDRRHLLLVLLTALALYVLVPQFGDFRSSWQLLSHPDASFTAGAVTLTFATYFAGAGTYRFLSFRPLRYVRTVAVQLAAMFINRLVPAGIGALGINYLYLRHVRHTASQAASVVAVNNLLGFAGHGLLVLVALLATGGNSKVVPDLSIDPSLALAAGLAVGLLLVAIIALGRRKVARGFRDVMKQLLSYRNRPLSVVAALGTSTLLTLCNVLSLFCCAYALDIQLTFVAVLLVFTFGVSAGAAVPTPGGLGGFEAGLAAGFIAYGVDAGAALAAALLYRLVSYWLPLAAGLPAFILCQRQKLFNPASTP